MGLLTQSAHRTPRHMCLNKIWACSPTKLIAHMGMGMLSQPTPTTHKHGCLIYGACSPDPSVRAVGMLALYVGMLAQPANTCRHACLNNILDMTWACLPNTWACSPDLPLGRLGMLAGSIHGHAHPLSLQDTWACSPQPADRTIRHACLLYGHAHLTAQ